MCSNAFVTLLFVVLARTLGLVTNRFTETQNEMGELNNIVPTPAKESMANCTTDGQSCIDKLVDKLVERTLQVSAISRISDELHTSSFEAPKPYAWAGASGGAKYSPVVHSARRDVAFLHPTQSGWREHLRADESPLRRHVGDVKTRQPRASSIKMRAVAEAQITEGAIKSLEQQAPLLEDAGLLSQDISYSCPLAYRYTSGVDAMAAPADDMFSNKMSGDSFIALMDEVRSRLRDFPDSNLTVIRNFRPEPNVVICRWRITFDRVSVLGSSQYRLKDGKIVSIAENWETQKGDGSLFGNSLSFQLVRRPVGQPKYSNDGFVSGYKLAIWEAVKSDRNFPADQILREDVDRLSPSVLYGVAGMVSIDVFLIAAKIIKAILG